MNMWLGSGGSTKSSGASTAARLARRGRRRASDLVTPPMRCGRAVGGSASRRSARSGLGEGAADALGVTSAVEQPVAGGGVVERLGEQLGRSDAPRRRGRSSVPAKASCSSRARFTQRMSSKSSSSALVGGQPA